MNTKGAYLSLIHAKHKAGFSVCIAYDPERLNHGT